MLTAARWSIAFKTVIAGAVLSGSIVGAQKFIPKVKGTSRATASRTVLVPRTHGVDAVSGLKIDSTLRLVTAENGRGANMGGSRDGRIEFKINRRVDPSAIELHCSWDDILVVRSGEGILRHGANIDEPKRVWNYEWRARRIVKPLEVPLSVGDVVRIPAGEAHEIHVSSSEPLVYLTIKTLSVVRDACQELPYEGK